MSNFFGHLKTITKHRHAVLKNCFRCGLYKRGLLHDLSKYSLVEFVPGVKYYQGTRSPNEKERELFGYSKAWLHHKGRNKHHWEYWSDYDSVAKKYMPVEMPREFVFEMFCDRVAASQIYKGKNFKNSDPIDYYTGKMDHYLMHPKTAEMIKKLLTMYRDAGPEETFRYIRNQVKNR